MDGRLREFFEAAGVYEEVANKILVLSTDDDDDDRRGPFVFLHESLEGTCLRAALGQYGASRRPRSETIESQEDPFRDIDAAAKRLRAALVHRGEFRTVIEPALNDLFATVGRHMFRVDEVGRLDEAAGGDLLASNLADRLNLTDGQRDNLVRVGSLPLSVVRTLFENPKLLYQVSPRKFEEIIAELLANLGFRNVELTATSKDGGRDILACQVFASIPVSFYFECKRYAANNLVGVETVRSLLGVLSHEQRNVNKGVLVTTATFTSGARSLIAAEARLDGKDYDDVLGWMQQVCRGRGT